MLLKTAPAASTIGQSRYPKQIRRDFDVDVSWCYYKCAFSCYSSHKQSKFKNHIIPGRCFVCSSAESHVVGREYQNGEVRLPRHSHQILYRGFGTLEYA